MSWPLENLYRLTDRDTVSALWGPRFVNVTASSAATAVTAGGDGTDVDVPLDRDFFVSNICVDCDPGAGQTSTIAIVYLTDDSGNILAELCGDAQVLVADQRRVFSRRVELVLTDRHHIQCVAGFDAGVAANAVILSLAGIYIPRGNLVLF